MNDINGMNVINGNVFPEEIQKVTPQIKNSRSIRKEGKILSKPSQVCE